MLYKNRADKRYDALISGELHYCFGKSKPDTPDYRAAAEETAQSNMEMLQYQTQSNRATQNTPFGSQEWTQGVDADGNPNNQWTQNTTLTPESQRALDAQLGLTADRSELGGSLMGRAENEFGEEMDWSALPEVGSGAGARDRAEENLYGRQTSRLDPQWEQREEQTMARLVAQGLRPGDPAYDQAMENMGRERTDAYDRASSSAIAAGGKEADRQYGLESNDRNRQLAEEMQKRGMSLNEINAIISGQQVGLPSMPGYKTAGRADGVDYSGAEGNQYSASADNASINNKAFENALYGGASLAMMCDRRLKRNVTRIGMIGQYPLYLFQYIWGKWAVGPMADEVNQDAVTRLPSGYDMVDLARVK
jgi:hypothetical protein